MQMDREQLLDELGRCYMRAFVDQLLRGEFGTPTQPCRAAQGRIDVPEDSGHGGSTANCGEPAS